MSGTLNKWTDGQAVTTPDLQRGDDAAAAADDLVYEALMPVVASGYGTKRVLPLMAEDEGGTPQQLVSEVSSGILGVKPALFEVGVVDGLMYRVAHAARTRTNLESLGVSANPGGSPRTDLLYATVQFATTSAETRKVKSSTGAITSPSVPVEQRPTVTLSIAAGTTSAPADGATAWNIPLAELTVPAGYVFGGFITSFKEVWHRAFVAASAARSVLGSNFGAGVAGVIEPVSPAPDWSRFGAERKFVVPFLHLTNGATAWNLPDRVALVNWNNRLVQFTLVRPASHAGAYPRPHAVTVVGASLSETSSWVHTGSDGGTLWTSARGFVLSVNASGQLNLSKPAGAAADSGSGDNWLLLVESTDRFI